jgi:hypothetical protein
VSKRSTHAYQRSGTATTWEKYNGVRGVVVEVKMGHDDVEEDILDVTKENSVVNIFDSQDRLILT